MGGRLRTDRPRVLGPAGGPIDSRSWNRAPTWAGATMTTWRGRRAALPAGEPGRRWLRGRSRAPLSLHVGRDGQRDRLGRDRRGDGPGGFARGLRRRGAAPAVGRGGRSTGSSATWAMRRPTAMNLIHSPGEPALEAAVVDLYLAAEGPAGRGLGLPEPDPAGGPLPGRGHPPRRSRAGSWRRTGSSPRSRGSRWPRSSWPRRRSGSSASWSRRARSRPSRPNGPRGSRWPRTSPPRPTRAGIPTISRRSSCCRRCWRSAIGCRPSTATTGRSRIGAAGGISTPWAAAAALAMGAAYLVTGSVNQSCVEAGDVRRRPEDARPGAAGRRGDGPRGRHVRDGREGPGAQARHAVRHAGRQALRALPDPRGPRPDPARRAGEPGEDDLPGPDRGDLGADPGLLPRARPDADRAGRARPQAEDGAGLPLVPGDVVAVGQRRRAVADGRLPGLVRPGDGGLQRLGARVVPGAARGASGRDGRPEHPLRCGRPDPRPDPGRPGRRPARRESPG